MKTSIIAAAFFAAAIAPVAALAHPAGGADEGQNIAIQACTGFNEYGPVDVVSVVKDGMGDYLIWLEDVDEDLWACNANASGDVYANVIVYDDLLEGEGASMLQLVSGGATRHPERQAERLCLAVADDDAFEIVATAEDGLGDYVVWLTADDETFIMCNASADGRLYAFEEVGMPLNDGYVIEPATAGTSPAGSTPSGPGRPGQFG
jgi:hypothetical protein